MTVFLREFFYFFPGSRAEPWARKESREPPPNERTNPLLFHRFSASEPRFWFESFTPSAPQKEDPKKARPCLPFGCKAPCTHLGESLAPAVIAECAADPSVIHAPRTFVARGALWRGPRITFARMAHSIARRRSLLRREGVLLAGIVLRRHEGTNFHAAGA